jgi:BON domain
MPQALARSAPRLEPAPGSANEVPKNTRVAHHGAACGVLRDEPPAIGGAGFRQSGSARRTARLRRDARRRGAREHIYGALNADPIYYFRHVDVKVYRGVANLSGYVWSADAIYRARKITSGVPGVTRVETNQLQLERNGRDSGPAR